MKIGDTVVVIAGKDRNKTGKIIKILKNNKVVVEGVNMVTKHVKPSAQNEQGGIIKTEAAIDISNVMILDPKTNKRTRIGHTIDKKGNKVRCTKKSNEILN